MPTNLTRRPGSSYARPLSQAPLAFAMIIATALTGTSSPAAETIRVATFNVSLYGHRGGEVLERLRAGDDPQSQRLAEIIQRVRPDVLLLNEIDYDSKGEVVLTFCQKYLNVAQNASGAIDGAAEAIEYSHRYSAPSNTGRHSGFDLDRDGAADPTRGGRAYGGDCWGFGLYEGQYGMAVLSKFPIDEAAVRTFQNFRWKDMPKAQLPDDASTPAPGDWYSADVLAKFPLSSKSHWDVLVLINGKRLHLLASHPTPPVFDGAENRNGRRNHDEIRFWVDYVSERSGDRSQGSGVGDQQENPPPLKGWEQPSTGDPKSPERRAVVASEGIRGGTNDATKPTGSNPSTISPESPLTQPLPSGERGRSYIYDDNGQRGGLASSESFVILGDLNGDPHDGDAPEGIIKLLASPRLLTYPAPESAGAAEQARLQGRPNDRHRGDPRQDTADAADGSGPGNLRLDYVLPSADLRVAASGVFWPETSDPLFPLVGVEPFPSSDHRLVWVDIEL